MLIFRAALVMGLAMIALPGAALDNGECASTYYDSVINESQIDWIEESREEINEGEGGVITYYTSKQELVALNKRKSVKFCASSHCDSIEIYEGKNGFSVHTIQWGGVVNAPKERSLIYQNVNGISCLLNHSGGDTFLNAAKNRVGVLFEYAED